MDKITQIRALLRSITGTDKSTIHFRLMEVVGVDGDLCRAKIGDFEIPDIRLSSIGGGSENGLLIVPAQGSIILVADISCGDLRELNAIGYSEIDSIRFHNGKTTVQADAQTAEVSVGGSKVRITDQVVAFNDGHNEGMVNVVGLTDKLNTIERSVNDLKTVFATWVPGTADGGAALKGAVAAWAASLLATTQQREIEDDKVTH